MIHGSLTGLKTSQVKALERIQHRRLPTDQVLTPELARYLTERSQELRRQIGLIIDRTGQVVHLILGDDREIVIPDLSGVGMGRSGLRGLRCVHTHLRGEPISQDDLNDLALLRLDMMAVLEVKADGLPGRLEYAHLIPPDGQGEIIFRQTVPSLYQWDFDFNAFIRALDSELERSRAETVDLGDSREKAILLSVTSASRREADDSLDELTELARTADVVVLDRMTQRPRQFNPRTLMGEGKLKEVVISALHKGATMLVFDQDLTPVQIRSIADMTELKVIDRSQLILDIFARRAHTLDGKVQVELAQLKYILPRLTGKGTAMSRLMGGIGGRGPGETKIEIDRRRIRDRIRRLEKQLDNLGKGRLQRRQRRVKAGVPIVSIVGYTNAGKSTLLNALTRSAVFTEDLLFATLDTATRRLRFPQEREVIITDTVGFIRHLPPSLMGAFKATLEELADAQMLLQVVDISNPRFEEQISAVERILKDLDLAGIERLLIFNKIDLVDDQQVEALCQRYEALPVCARDPQSFAALMSYMEERFWGEECRFD
ncbi:MAG: GTPase HflX [Desulfuromonas sp.]|nr:MAG: GTPase HflX [Desulfuromonas sp.]